MEFFKKYQWKGNVRQLKNVIKKIIKLRSINNDRNDITLKDIQQELFRDSPTNIEHINKNIGRRKRPSDEELIRLKNENLTQEQIAEQVGVTRETVNRWYAKMNKETQSALTSSI